MIMCILICSGMPIADRPVFDNFRRRRIAILTGYLMYIFSSISKTDPNSPSGKKCNDLQNIAIRCNPFFCCLVCGRK